MKYIIFSICITTFLSASYLIAKFQPQSIELHHEANKFEDFLNNLDYTRVNTTEYKFSIIGDKPKIELDSFKLLNKKNSEI